MDTRVVADPEQVAPGDHGRGALGTVVIAVAWVGLAVWRPTVTYHLAPILVTGAWPYLLRRGPLRVANRDAMRAAVGALAVAIVAALVIVALDAMRGPTLWGDGHAIWEVVPAAIAGAAVGYRLARCGVAVEDDSVASAPGS